MHEECKVYQMPIRVLYKNYRGETWWRTIIPQEIFYGSNEYHKENQWLLKVQDIEKQAEIIYAMADIKEWQY